MQPLCDCYHTLRYPAVPLWTQLLVHPLQQIADGLYPRGSNPGPTLYLKYPYWRTPLPVHLPVYQTWPHLWRCNSWDFNKESPLPVMPYTVTNTYLRCRVNYLRCRVTYLRCCVNYLRCFRTEHPPLCTVTRTFLSTQDSGDVPLSCLYLSSLMLGTAPRN